MGEDRHPKLRYIAVGDGGMYLYREPTPQDADNDYSDPAIVPMIGMDPYLNCVGVYFQFKKDSQFCFAAQFYAVGLQPIGDEDDKCTPTQGERLKEMVLAKLQSTEIDENWDLDRDFIRQNILMICPVREWNRPAAVKPTVGAYVVEAIREFLGDESLPVDPADGFYVDRRTEVATKLHWEEEMGVHGEWSPAELQRRFSIILEDDGDWHITV